MKALWAVLGLALAACAAFVLWKNLDRNVLGMALHILTAFPLSRILTALAFSAISFLLAGLCEDAALREIGRPLGLVRPLLVTAIANPIGHALSVPTLSGGAIRYRMYSGWAFERKDIGRLVVLSALPFLLGVTVLLSGALLVSHDQFDSVVHLPPAVAVSAAVAGLAVSVAYLFGTGTRAFAARLPSFRLTALQLVCGIVEILLVAATLYIFMPHDAAVGPAAFLGVYLIGVLLGQFSSIPAGLGVLEASLILLLPQVPKGQLIAAALAYRVVFDLIPLLAALVLFMIYETGSRRGVIGRWWRAQRAAD